MLDRKNSSRPQLINDAIYQSVVALYSGKATLVGILQGKRKKITRIRVGTFTTPTTFRGHAPWEHHLLLRPIQYFFSAKKKLRKCRGLRGTTTKALFFRDKATLVVQEERRRSRAERYIRDNNKQFLIETIRNNVKYKLRILVKLKKKEPSNIISVLFHKFIIMICNFYSIVSSKF